MGIFEIKTNTAEETKTVAEQLAKKLQPGDVVTLDGDLGAGKTTFTKGLARGLGIKRTVNSPTFTMIKEYDGRLPLYHMDVYRLQDSDEDLGFDEYFEGEGVTVVEWAHLIENQLPSDLLQISIRRVNENERTLILKPASERFVSLCKELYGNESFSN